MGHVLRPRVEYIHVDWLASRVQLKVIEGYIKKGVGKLVCGCDIKGHGCVITAEDNVGPDLIL